VSAPATRADVGGRAAPARALNVVVSGALVTVAAVRAPPLLLALAVAAAGAASIEVLWPLHDRRRARSSWPTDLVHAVGNRFLMYPPAYAALTVLGPVAAGVVPGPVRTAVQALPWWAQVTVVLVLSDLVNYVNHRAMHRVPLLWRVHAVHHSSEHLDWLATARAHPLDQALTVTATMLPALALGYLDALPWLVTLFFLYYPFVSHANARIRVPIVDRVIVTPSFHHWHHADEPDARDVNFGGFLCVWDRLLGTAHEPGGFPTRYGTADGALARRDYLGHLLSPLRRQPPASLP
jgi:sterol desaturase/sphingolipid hydroxylase (fatty acid hydroxylase superfamily)